MKIKRLVLLALFTALTLFCTPLLQAQALTEGTVANGAEIALGTNAIADGVWTIAIGYGASAFNPNGADENFNYPGSIAIGRDATVNGNGSLSLADGATAIGYSSIAIGDGATVGVYEQGNITDNEIDYGISIGGSSRVSAEHGISIGAFANSRASEAIALGYFATASGNSAIAQGKGSEASAPNTIAIGRDSTASGEASVSLGYSANASSDQNIAIGNNTQSIGTSSIAIGPGARADSVNSLAFGPGSLVEEQNSETSENSIAIGPGAKVIKASSSIAIGENASIGGDFYSSTGSIVIGANAQTIPNTDLQFARVDYAVVIGYGASASYQGSWLGSAGSGGSRSISIGYNSQARGSDQIAIGSYAVASGYSGERGGSAIAIGNYADASLEGIAIGHSASVAERNIAIGRNAKIDYDSIYSVAIGDGATVETDDRSNAVALGANSRAVEEYTLSIGREAYEVTDDDGDTTKYSAFTRRLVNMSAGQKDTDAVNVSQLKTLGTNVASALGGTSSYSFNSSDGTGTLATGLEVGGTTYTSVQDALNAIDGGTGGGSTLSVNYDDESKETVTLGNTSGATTVTNVKAGELSETSTDAVNGSQLYETNQNLASLNGLAVKYDDESKTSITLGNGADKVSIKNLADGVDANDAVNKGQLDAGIADAKASGKWNLKVNDSAAEEISGGKVVTLKDGTNVAITKDADGNYVFSTVAAPEFDSVTIRNTNISINSDGIDMGDKKIINLQRGDVSEGSSDAVTGGQLYETNQTIQQLDASSVQYDDGSDKTKITLEGTGGTTITNVKAGELSETSTDAVNGSQLYETNQNLASLDGLAVKYKEGSANRLELNDGDNGTVRISNVATPENDTDAANKKYVDDKTTDISEDLEGLSGSVVKYNEGSDKTKITLEGTGGTTITNVKAGELSETSTDAVNGSQLYETNLNLASLNGLAVKYDDESKTSITLGNGADKVTIKNVADGVDTNDAVNKGQLDAGIADAKASGKWNLKVNDSAAEEISGGKVVTLKDGTNVAITKDADGNYVFSTVAAPEFDSVTIRNTNISINSDGIDMGDKKIINLQRGDVSEGSSDAVTGGQLYETNQTIQQLDASSVQYDDGSDKTKITLEGTGGTTITNVKAGELSETSTDAVNGSQLYETNQNLASLDGLAVKYKEGSTNRLELNDGDNGTVRISNVATPENDTDAANKKYVDDKTKDISEDLEGLSGSVVKYDEGSDKTKITLEGSGGTTITNVKAGELSETSTDAVNGSQLYATNERVGDLETNVGDITTNLSKLDGLAVKYDDESKTSISLGNGTDKVTIKNVADGVDANDAVNKGQLDKGLEDTLASANAKSKWSLKVNDGEAEEIGDGKVVTLKDGTNVAITKDADGNYVFSTVAAPEFDAISIRNTNISISSTGINMGGLKITNLQRGDVSEGSTDAVTGGQLHETNQRIDEIETNVGSLSNSAVKYDDETKSSVTLEGADGTRIGNVADGVDAKDAVNKGQLDSVKSELEGQISENVTNINNKIENIEGDITNLDDRVTKLEDLDYLGDAAVTYDGNDKSSVTLKGENGTKISNLADGTEESDAVNFGQLSEVKGLSEANAEKLEEHSVYIENHEQEFKTLQTVLGDGYSNPTFNTIKIGNISSDGTNINMGGGIITGLGDGGIYQGSTDAVTGNQLWNAYKRMDDLQESINIVGAHAAAMSGLHPVPYNPYEPTTLSAAFGTYRDEYAVAVGVFHYVRSNLMFNLGASLCSDGDIMGRAGVSIAVGPNSKKKPELARDMVSMQQQQIQSQYRIQELEAEIAALKQQITQITNISK